MQQVVGVAEVGEVGEVVVGFSSARDKIFVQIRATVCSVVVCNVSWAALMPKAPEDNATTYVFKGSDNGVASKDRFSFPLGSNGKEGRGRNRLGTM